MYIVVPTGLTQTYGLKKNIPLWSMKIFHKLAMHRCRAASPRGAGSWPRRHAVHLIQEDCWEVPTQESWEIRIGGYLVVLGDRMIYSFLRGQSLLNPHCWMVF